MPETLFTGLFPPSPPPCPQDSYPHGDTNQDIHSDAESLDSSLSSIPPQSPRKPFSSRLKVQHLKLNSLPEIIAPPSRETTPESYRRAAKIKGDIQASMERFRSEHRSAELGAAYFGDRTALFCTQFARCELEGPKRKKRRTDAPPVKEVWDVGYGMGLPPLVDTEAEWEAWEKEFEAKKAAAIQAKKEVQAKRRRRHASPKRNPEPQPQPPPAPQATSPVMGLGTRVENWRNNVLPSSQPGSQVLAPELSRSQVQKETFAGSGKPSQSSQLSFKVMKKASTADVKGNAADLPSRPLKRRELPPSVPVIDPLRDIFIESSQPQANGETAEVDEDKQDQEQSYHSPVSLHASDGQRIMNETQQTEESIRIIAAYAADNPAERLRLHHDPLTSSQESANFSVIHSWSNSYPDDPQYLDSQHDLSLPAPTGRDNLAPSHLAPYSEGSGEIDMAHERVGDATYHPRRPPPAELRLSEIMHVDGDEVMEKDVKDSLYRIEVPSVVDDSGERPSFNQVVESTPNPPNPPNHSVHEPDHESVPHSQSLAGQVDRSFVADSEANRTALPAEAPSFNGVLTSTQHKSPHETGGKVAEEEVVPEIRKVTPRKPPSSKQVPNGDTSVEDLSFKGVVQSTQTSRAVDPPFTRAVRDNAAGANTLPREREASQEGQDDVDALSFEHVITSTQAPAAAEPVKVAEAQHVNGKIKPNGQSSPEILVPCSQTSEVTPPTSPTPSRKRKRSIEETEDRVQTSAPSPSTPTHASRLAIPSSTLTPPTTPSVKEMNASKGEAARDVYRTPTSAKRLTNLADLVRPFTAGSSSSTSPNRFNLADLGKASPRGSRTPIRGSTIRTFSALGKEKDKNITPLGPDSPFSTPPSAVRRLLDREDSPPSLRKPGMTRTGFGAAKLLEPQTSGLFGMEYNSQFQIEENVEEVADFLKRDVWGGDESP